MNLIAFGLLASLPVHVLAIIAGRRTTTTRQRIAFISGILGLISIPAVLISSVLSLCVAGACADGFTKSDLVGVLFLVLLVSSVAALLAMALGRRRA